MQFSIVALAVALCATPIASLGINCRGSSNCYGCGTPMTEVTSAINSISDTVVYKDGEQIACAKCPGGHGLRWDSNIGGTCAFAQKLPKKNDGSVGTVTGAQIKAAVARLVKHGCDNCGSAPLDEAKNDVNAGEITINYTMDHCGWGKCDPKA